MVQLEEVPDDELHPSQPGPKEDEDDWDTDSGSSSAIHPNASVRNLLPF